MPFLTINGIEIPIASSGEIRPEEIGSRAKAFNGTTLIDRRAIKRRWRFLTSQLTETEFKLIEAILLVKGQLFNFSDHVVGDTPASVPFSSKGLAATGTFGGEFPIAAGKVGGHPVVDVDNVADALSGTAMHTSDTVPNQAVANVARGGDASQDTTGFTVLGAGSVAYDTTRAWKGSSSILVDPSGVDLGVTVVPNTLTLDNDFLVTCYVLPAVDDTIKVRLKGDSTTNSWSSISVTAGQWKRVTVKQTLASPNANPKVDIASAGGTDFYLDGVFLVDNVGASAVVPPWVTSSYVSNAMTLPTSLITSPEFSVSLWVQMNWASTTEAGEELLEVATPSHVDAFEFSRLASSTNLRFQFRDSTGTSRQVTSTGLFASSAWHHLAATATATEVRVFVNGTQIQAWTGLANPPMIFDAAPNAPTTFSIGHRSGALQWRGKIDELLVLPAVLDQATITALQTTPWGALPTVVAAGDFNPKAVNVVPMISTEAYKTGRIAGTWTPTQRQISFELQEV
jgi:hypothetical protein